MSSQGKKGKKKAKPKAISLNDFLGDSQSPGMITNLDWADQPEDDYHSVNNSLAYQSTSAPRVIQLPTAPRAARTVEIDHSRIPENGPYTAFLGNLPYEVNQSVLEEFFKGLTIVNVRLPEENGRFKGFGYVQFADKLSLIKALEMNEETLQKRNIRVDIADNQNRDSGNSWNRSVGDRYGSQNSGPDPTEGNWRKAQAEEASRQPEHYSDKRGSFKNEDYDYGGGNRYRKSSRDYDYDRRPSDRQGYGYRGGYDDRGGHDRNRGYDRGYDDKNGYSRNDDHGYDRRYGNRGYDRSRSDGGGRYGRESEPPRERPQLRLQPRQKPLEDKDDSSVRSSSIFGSAKPVDTTARERAIEEKLYMQQKSLEETPKAEKRSTNIFGEAKPVDTTAREREIEEKLSSHKEKLLSVANQPSVSARASVFGDAKPVDTSVREREIEEKLRKKEENIVHSSNKSDEDFEHRSRISSQHSDDYHQSSPRRSRNSSVRSSEGHVDSSISQKSQASIEVLKPQYKPAPIPKENAWGKKSFTTDKPFAHSIAPKQLNVKPAPAPSTNSWSKGAPRTDQRGVREEAEGSREEEEERMPEGAADEETPVVNRGQPGDGSEENERNFSTRRDPPRFKSDRNTDSYQERNRSGKYGNKYGPGTNQYRNRNQSDGSSNYRENRRRGDGDSHSYSRDGSSVSNYYGGGRRDGGGRSKTKNESERRRDSSRDSRPECDRSDGAGQEQPTQERQTMKSKPKLKQIERDAPVDFVTQSKFALLSVEDGDDSVDLD